MLLLYRLLGGLYLVSGVWCSIQLGPASTFLGFNLEESKGFAEFFSVYGGLQVGLGLAMLITSFKTCYVEASVYFSAVFSTSLAIFRLFSFVFYGFVSDFVAMLILEIIMAVLLWLVWYKQRLSAS